MIIPFNTTYHSANEEAYVLQALKSGLHCGNHTFCDKVIRLMQDKHGFKSVFLTPSGTAALEMGALLANIQPGDEVILPSYTFSSTANAIVIFGAIPIFCEVDPNTMNIDVEKIEALITPKTKMIIPIDYAGVPCEIESIVAIAEKYNLIVMQDCAQSYGSYYKGKACGTQAHLAVFSFHETKNFSAGEGGALIVNKPAWIERAHFLQEKGTDRRLVICGIKNKYSWVDKGSSYLLSDILAALLFSQLEIEDEIKEKRAKISEAYFKAVIPFVQSGKISIYQINNDQHLNHHAFWLIFDKKENSEQFLIQLKGNSISAYIGYLPLHSSPMGISYGYKPDDLPITEDLGKKIVRLPFYTQLADDGLEFCTRTIESVLSSIYPLEL